MSSVSVSGTATASAPCQKVVVKMRLRRTNSSSRVARTEAKSALDELHRRLKDLAAHGIRFDQDAMVAHFSLSASYRTRGGDEGTASASRVYEAVYSLAVVSEDHERFSDIFDAVMNLEGLEADSPAFEVDAATEQELRNDAFRAAVKQAKARFAFQCTVIGLDPQEFQVTSWTYDRGMRASSEGKRLVVDSEQASTRGGRVEVTTTVNLVHERKSDRN